MGGFIKLDRKFFNHFLWKEQRSLSRAEAWLDLIQLAAYSDDNAQIINRSLVKYGRGQYPASLSFLMKRWNWSINKVRTYLSTLERAGQITRQTTSGITIITLCNYDQYNGEPQSERQDEGQDEGQADNKLTAGNKEYKEPKKTKKKKKEIDCFSFFSNYSDSLDLFEKWKEWVEFRTEMRSPYRTQKGVETSFRKLLKDASQDPVLAIKIIDQSIANEWQGLFPLKEGSNGRPVNGKHLSAARQAYEKSLLEE